MKELPVQGEIFPPDSKFNSRYAIEKRLNKKTADNKPKKNKPGRKINNLKGERFGALTVLRMTDKRHHAGVVFLCRCDCGRLIEATARHLQRKDSPTTHCGCQGVYRNGRPAPGTRGINWSIVRASNPKTAFNSLFAHYRNTASNRGIQWKLSKKQFRGLVTKDCHYCGVEPAQVFKRDVHSFTYNGVDRIDSSGAYEIDNCVSCCGVCNTAKMDRTVDEFMEWIERIYKHQFYQGNEGLDIG